MTQPVQFFVFIENKIQEYQQQEYQIAAAAWGSNFKKGYTARVMRLGDIVISRNAKGSVL
jgi:hypothetical protein